MITLLANAAVSAVLCAALIAGCAWERRQERKRSAPARHDGKPAGDPDAAVLAAYESDFARGVYAREPRRTRRRP